MFRYCQVSRNLFQYIKVWFLMIFKNKYVASYLSSTMKLILRAREIYLSGRALSSMYGALGSIPSLPRPPQKNVDSEISVIVFLWEQMEKWCQGCRSPFSECEGYISLGSTVC